MFIITDAFDVVQDLATEKANLSRGYNYPGYKLYENVELGDIRPGDTFDGVKVTHNNAAREEARRRALKRHLIQLHSDRDKAVTLKYDDLAAELQAEIAKCQEELATLSS
jgi:hypothetical protein